MTQTRIRPPAHTLTVRIPDDFLLTFKGFIAAQNDNLMDVRPLVTLTDKGHTGAQEKGEGKS